MQRTFGVLTVVILAACTGSESRVRFDSRALRQEARLAGVVLARAEVRVTAEDFATPLSAVVDADTDTFSFTLPAGPQRTFRLDAVQLLADSEGAFTNLPVEVPAFLGQRTVDLAPGELDLELSVRRVGMLVVDVSRLDGEPLPEYLAVNIVSTTSALDQQATVIDGRAVATVAIGTYDVSVSFSEGAAVLATLAADVVVGTGERRLVDLVVEPPAAELTIGGHVYGFTGSGLSVSLNDGAALPLSPNTNFTFPGMLSTAEGYEVVVVDQPTNGAGGADDFCTVLGGSGTLGTTSVTDLRVFCVSPVVPKHPSAPGFTDWFHRQPSESACDGSEPATLEGCERGGPLRTATVPGLTCAEVTRLTDALGGFAWSCFDENGTARLFSQAQISPVGQLIDPLAHAWRPNTLVLELGPGAELRSDSVPWFNNPIVAANNGGILADPDTLYIVTQDVTVDGTTVSLYSLEAAGAALIVVPGATLRASGMSASIASLLADDLYVEGAFANTGYLEGGTFVTAGSGYRNLVVRDVTAICEEIDPGTGAIPGVLDVYDGVRPIVQNLQMIGCGSGDAIVFSNASGFLFEDIVVSSVYSAIVGNSDSAVDGTIRRVRVVNSFWNGIHALGNRLRLEDLYLANNGAAGLVLGYAGGDFPGVGNIVRRVQSFNNSGAGIVLVRQTGLRATDLLSAHNDEGVIVENSANAVLQNITTGLNSFGNYVVRGSSSDIITQRLLSVGNGVSGGVGLQLDDANNTFFEDLAVTDGMTGVSLNLVSNIGFMGRVHIGGNSIDCVYGSIGSNVGMFDNTGAAGTLCDLQSPSAGTLTLGTTLASAFIGGSASPLALWDDITDWTAFVPFQTVGGGGTLPASGFGPCGAGLGCYLFDWQLIGGSPAVGNGTAPAPTDVLVMNWEIPATSQAECDAVMSGTLFESSGTCVTLILDDASELQFFGDGDGLCDHDDVCVLTPNLGAYQGPGPAGGASSTTLTGAGPFDSTPAVSSVILTIPTTFSTVGVE